jgi:taurine dioxygenase
MIHPFERAMGRTDPIHTVIDRPEDVPDRTGWHTDDSYLECPPSYAVLRCEVAPEFGGDTSWVNMVAAYEVLSASMKQFLSRLVGFHATDRGLLDYVRTHLPPGKVEEAMTAVGEGAAHPVVRSHGSSGAKALYFEPNFMRKVVGLSDQESRFVCDFLARCVANVSLQCRFRWQAGDVAIWDERTTQHTGSSDHAGQLRVLRRCTVEGEPPN